MSLGFQTVKNSTLRVCLAATLIAAAGKAAALGFGDLRGSPVLGEKARFEVELLGSGTAYLDATCFRLKQPGGDSGLPWLKQATFTVRHGTPAVLEVRSPTTLSEPAFAVAVYVGCGHDIVREYVVLAGKPTAPVVEAPAPRKSAVTQAPAKRSQSAPARPAPRPAASPAPTPAAAPAPAVAAGSAVAPLGEAAKGQPAQDSTMPADEKIKRMEATVGELQQRAAELTQKIEQAQPQPATAPAPAAPPAPVAVAPARAAVAQAEEGSNWGLYGAVLAMLAAVAGVFGWRTYGQRRDTASGSLGIPEVVVDPQRKSERVERAGPDLQADPAALLTPVKIAPVAPGTPPAAGPGVKLDSLMSVSAATVDEHFEANPVMELAEIMLSFGRVKGAAQALQEYIDANPQDALKPWVRLMDVYRMAGMRHEFEKVARELNKHFNVQIQQWETQAEGSEGAVDVVLDVDNARPGLVAAGSADAGIEGVAWIMEQVMMRWPAGDVVDYLNQLLRDNRGGTRTGFSLPVVNDIMFLIDLKEVSSRLEGEAAKA
jgi:hypothetical protein